MKSEIKNYVHKDERVQRQRADKELIIIVIALLTLGTIMIFSASYPYANSHYNDGFYYLKSNILIDL